MGNSKGRYLGKRGSREAYVTFYLEGADECALALNNLLKIPEYVRSHLGDVANDIIVPAMDRTKESESRFADNAPNTIRLKGYNHPWNSDEHITGYAYVSDNGGDSIRVGLSGEDNVVSRNSDVVSVSDIISYVNNGYREGNSIVPSRPLFMYTWDSCKGDVQRAVRTLFQNAKVLG